MHTRTPISHPDPDGQGIQPAAGRTDVVNHITDPDLLQILQNTPDVEEARDVVQHLHQLSLDFPSSPAPQSLHSDWETFVSSKFVFIWDLLIVCGLFGLVYNTTRRNRKVQAWEISKPGMLVWL